MQNRKKGNLLTVIFMAISLTVAGVFSSCTDSGIFPSDSAIKQEGNLPDDNPPVYLWPKGTKYYYAFDEKIYLNEVENKIVVSFDEKYLSDIQLYLQKNEQIRHMELLYFRNGYILTTHAIASPNTVTDIQMLMEDLKKQAGVKSVNPMYATSDGLEMPVTDEFVVQFKENASKQAIDEMRKKYHIEIKEITKLFFIFSVPVDSNVLEVANAYQESWLTNFSNPTFFAKLTHSNY